VEGFSLPLAAERFTRFIRLPAIRIPEVDRGGDHDIADDAWQLADERLAVHRGTRFDDDLIDATAVLHDPTVLDVSVIDDFEAFLRRWHKEWIERSVSEVCGKMPLERMAHPGTFGFKIAFVIGIGGLAERELLDDF
jgi:hypothetical protein